MTTKAKTFPKKKTVVKTGVLQADKPTEVLVAKPIQNTVSENPFVGGFGKKSEKEDSYKFPSKKSTRRSFLLALCLARSTDEEEDSIPPTDEQRLAKGNVMFPKPQNRSMIRSSDRILSSETTSETRARLTS